MSRRNPNSAPAAWYPVNLTPRLHPSRHREGAVCRLPDDPIFPIPSRIPEPGYLVRVWAVAVRRWCWRAAGITMRDIVTRNGRFSVNRTELDISLPLDTVDLRIRLMGLDLDPGWLPWFGRVVRFHYTAGRDYRG